MPGYKLFHGARVLDVRQWDLVCPNNAQRQLSKTLVLVGKMVGSIICGQVADFVGRKKAFTLAILIMVSQRVQQRWQKRLGAEMGLILWHQN